ncbi:hypothetical protein ACHAW6_012983 [Cyclotella cf. meneghiniana]
MYILCKHSGYKFFTKLDISIQYYTFELDEYSQDLCTIITSFGKHKYLRLPMGLKCSPDIALSIVESVLAGIDDADLYIDDVGAFSQTWDHHIKLLGNILHGLCENGFAINPLKCEWAIKETDWLRYWLNPCGLKPWKEKIDAILHMGCPQNATKLCMFISCFNYYQDMWPSHAHIFKPLTDHSGLKKHAPMPWTPGIQTTFNKMHAFLAADALAAYPDHNKRFNVYTDASDYQLGACILQQGQPAAYFSCKLSKSEQNYMVMEKEMLSIIATLDEFPGMLIDSDIHVFTGHKNFTFDTLKMQ